MSTTRRIHVRQPADDAFERGIAAIGQQMKLPQAFPPEVEAAAAKAADNPRLPDLDRTDIALVTIDPPESMDLDQAMYVETRDDGYRVYYAIADVAAFVRSGDPVDVEANKRGETLYGADAKIPLHPKVLSEGAASLLPDQMRPALLWSIDLDASGEGVAVDVRRARVKSRAKLDYAGVQSLLEAGAAKPMWGVLKRIGELRQQREQKRGGISLPLPEQEIHGEQGHWQLEYRTRRPIDDWNEQISLLTGMAAAHLMVKGKVGLLRTLPPPDPRDIQRLHRNATALDIDWPQGLSYPDFIRSLDPTKPAHIAMLVACTTVLRGAGYAAFNGSLPEQPMHSALAAEYAHATAPLRRLVDRYVGEVCVALCAGEPVPQWALDALPSLPETMAASGHRASQYEHAVVDLVEAVILQPRIGQDFTATIVELDHHDPDKGVVMLTDPAIEARVEGQAPLPLGTRIQVKLVEADPATRTTRFALA